MRGDAVPPEVFHPVEDEAHGAGIVVSVTTISNGIPKDRVLLVIEGECHEYGLSECGERCVGGVNTKDFDKKLNVCHMEGGQTRVSVPPLQYPPGQQRKKKPM